MRKGYSPLVLLSSVGDNRQHLRFCIKPVNGGDPVLRQVEFNEIFTKATWEAMFEASSMTNQGLFIESDINSFGYRYQPSN